VQAETVRADKVTTDLTVQQVYGDVTLASISDNYDFMALRGGLQPFNSDFRGFVFNDVNLGLRFYGNADNNLYQYNAGIFPMLERNTYSQLNTFNSRDQVVLAANVYRQDFLTPGYTAQLSLLGNIDYGRTHENRFGTQARPDPLGTPREHNLYAAYLGWTGHGHVQRLNLSHAFYQALGYDEANSLAGRSLTINARMAALEVSIDQDWLRYKASVFYASGDADTGDGIGRGFDAIVDTVDFAGGPFSYYVRNGFNLGGSGAGFKGPVSLLPNLRPSATESQANFVNPGLWLANLGLDLAFTPKLRGLVNANYLWFAETAPLKTALQTDQIDSEVGLDLSVGLQYRPWLSDNVALIAGLGLLVPGAGMRDIHGAPRPAAGLPAGSRNPDDLPEVLLHSLLALRLNY
jgi:hypothetical protein